MSHTKKPWVASGNGIHVGAQCVALTYMEPKDQRVADAIRIVACVNACAGSDTDDLLHYASIGGVEHIMSAIEARAVAAEQQRDELLGAAKNLRDVKGRYHSEQAFNALVEAIAKVEAANE